MADKPIIFSAPMVRALRDRLKTQTRRVLKPQPTGRPEFYMPMSDEDPFWAVFDADERGQRVRVPYAPGDRLWVRETWSAIMDGGWTIADARRRMFGEKIVYRADGNAYEDGDGWWPSIHMPREFSRLTLTVTDVRVQRLQEISDADAVAEGIDPLFSAEEVAARPECDSKPMPWTNYLWHGRHDVRRSWIDAWPHQYSGYINPRGSFSSLWNSIHGPDAWDANPWVAAYTFTVERANIDAKGGPA